MKVIIYLTLFSLLNKLSLAWCADSPSLAIGQRAFEMDYSPNMMYIVVGMQTMTRVYYVSNRTLRCTFNTGSINYGTVKFLPDSDAFILAYDNSNIKVIDSATCSLLHTINTNHIKVSDIDFNENGTKFVTCGDDDTFRVWDISATNIRSTSPPQIGGGFDTGVKIWSCKFSFDQYIILGCDSNLVRIYGPNFSNTIYLSNAHTVSGKAENVEFFYCSKDRYLMGSDNGRAYLESSLSPFLTTSSHIRLATVDRTNSFMVYGNENFQLKFVFTSDVTQMQQFTLPGKILSGDFSDDANILAIGCEDNTIRFMKRCGCASDTAAYNSLYCTGALPGSCYTNTNTTNATNITNSSSNNSTWNDTTNTTDNITGNVTDNTTGNTTVNLTDCTQNSTNCTNFTNCVNCTNVTNIVDLSTLTIEQFYRIYFQYWMIFLLPEQQNTDHYLIKALTLYHEQCNQLVTRVFLQQGLCNKYVRTGWKSWVQVYHPSLSTNKIQCHKDILQIYSTIKVDINDVENVFVLLPKPQLLETQPTSPAQWQQTLIQVRTNMSAINPLLYSPEQCKNIQNTRVYLKCVFIISCVMMIVGLLTGKIIGLQCFGILQLAYFNLANHGSIDIYLFQITKWSIFNGFNFVLQKEKTPFLPPRLQALGISGQFLNNFNVMGIASLRIFAILFAVRYIPFLFKLQFLTQYGGSILKQTTVTLALFNAYIVSYSAGVFFKYCSANSSTGEIYYLGLFSVIALLILLLILLVVFQTQTQNFGQFKLKLKDSILTRQYISFTLLMRLCIGFYISTQNQFWETTLFSIAICIVWLLYFLTNLPFIQFIHNYRAGIVHLAMLLVMLVGNYYGSMKKYVEIPVRGRLHGAALLELAAIGVVVAVSFMGFVFEAIILIRKIIHRLNRRKIKGEQNRNLSKNEETIQAINA